MFRRWAIFTVTSILFLLSQFYRAVNAVIAPDLIRDLALDTEELGLISAALFYSMALFQIPCGILLDRIGPRRTMTLLSLIAVIGAGIFSWADSWTMGILGRVLLGIGLASSLMGTLKLVTTWFGPASFSTLSGIIFSIGVIGSMVATTPLVLLVNNIGWRLAFRLIAGFNLLVALILYGIVRDTPQTNGQPGGSQNPEKRGYDVFANLFLLLKSRDYWIASCGSFFRYGIFAALQTLWAGPYLMGALQLSSLEAANIIFLMNLALIIGVPVWGWLSDRVLKTRKGVVLLGLAIHCATTFTLAMLSTDAGSFTLAVLFFCFGFASGTGMIMIAHVKEHMPIEMSGVAMTGINFFTGIGAAILVQGLGSLMQHLYPAAPQGIDAFQGGFLICAVCLLVVFLLYLLTRDAVSNHKYS